MQKITFKPCQGSGSIFGRGLHDGKRREEGRKQIEDRGVGGADIGNGLKRRTGTRKRGDLGKQGIKAL